MAFGAIADGISHPLSERYASLAAAQAVYPHAEALTDQIDWAAAQAAVNAIPSALPGGGEVHFPIGRYRFGVKGVFRNANAPIILRGQTASGYNEADSGIPGSVIVSDAGAAPAFTFGIPIGGVNHRGPIFENLTFRELGLGKTGTSIRIQNVNRWAIRDCAFRGADKAIDVFCDAGSGPGAAGADASWAHIENCWLKDCTYGLYNPYGTDITVVGGDWSCTTSILSYPAGSTTGCMVVIGAWFDGGLGVDLKSFGARLVACSFENCNPAVRIQRDATLHSNSGNSNIITSCVIDGTGSGDVGIDIGVGCTGTNILGQMITNVATPISDAGTSTTIIRADGTPLTLNRPVSSSVYHLLLRIAGIDALKIYGAGSSVIHFASLIAGGKVRWLLGGNTSTDEFAIQDVNNNNLFRMLGTGNASISGTLTIGSAGDAVLRRVAADTLEMGVGDHFKLDGTWNGGRLQLGGYHLWVDATGDLRMKSGAPTSDLDGAVVGGQT